MPNQADKPQGRFWQSLASSIIQVYKAGGFLLTFIFVGAMMMVAARFSDRLASLTTAGAVLTFACLLLFAWGHIYAQIQAHRHTPGLRKFRERLEGCWWERIDAEEGSALSIFWIEQELFSDSVHLHGQSYDKDGKPAAYWSTAMARVLPQDQKIEYLWQGKHERHDPNVAFHGFGEMIFNSPVDSSEKIARGSGRFWSVDESKKKAILKTIRLQRIQDQAIIDLMCNGTDSEVEKRIKHTLEHW